jgi:expansin (peptidoglycan-binding protein)
MTALVTQVVPNVGADIGALTVNASNGDTAACGSGTFLYVQNTGGSAVTVTLATPGKVDGRLDINDSTFSVAATSGIGIIPLIYNLYADPTTGLATITYSTAGATTKVAVVRVP